MKFKSLLLSITAMFGLLLLQSCGMGSSCDDLEPTYTYYNIDPAEKKDVLFTGTDTLVYISNKGDTAILFGQGKRSFTETVSAKSTPDCGTYAYNCFENIEFTYRGNNPYLNYIFFDFNACIYSPAQTYADITIGSVAYSTYLGALNHPLNYTDSVTINSRTYSGWILQGEMNIPALYNYKYGFLEIRTPGKVWLRQL